MDRDASILQFRQGDEPDVVDAVTRRFTYKMWTPLQIAQGKEVTEAFIQAALVVMKNVPPSPTRTRVLNELEMARMLANAAITHDGAF